MPRVSTWMKVDGADKYRRLSRRLKEAGRGDLQRRLARSVRREGESALADVKGAWTGVQVSGSSRGGTGHPDRSTGLRQRVAAATRIQVLQTGTRITVNTRKVDPRYPGLAWYLDGLGKPWRHPVFGRRGNAQDWQSQRGQEVFFATMNRHGPGWRRGIERVVDEVAREIEG
jgi:hypothetical protein